MELKHLLQRADINLIRKFVTLQPTPGNFLACLCFFPSSWWNTLESELLAGRGSASHLTSWGAKWHYCLELSRPHPSGRCPCMCVCVASAPVVAVLESQTWLPCVKGPSPQVAAKFRGVCVCVCVCLILGARQKPGGLSPAAAISFQH